MKKILYVVVIFVAGMILAGCSSVSDDYDLPGTSDETVSGDFIYRIVTEKTKYKGNEEIKMYAELEYIGDKPEITIYHADTPFDFSLVEKSRGYEIPHFHNQPLLSTVLIKGEPLRGEYKAGAGYSLSDENEYIEFMQSINEGQFPVGYYEVNGAAYFSLNTTFVGSEVKITAQVGFKVI